MNAEERGLAAFFRRAEPQQALSRQASAVDMTIAMVTTVAAVWTSVARARAYYDGQPGPDLLLLFVVALTAAPLAFRRRYPATAFCLMMAAVLVAHNYITTVTFAAVIFAAYSAVVYSRYRRLALLSVAVATIIVTALFPDTTPPVPARFTALLILAPTVAVALAVRTWRQRASDSAERLRRAEAEHEAETRRAVEAERTRIASELHDVVTHNVSVMVVQAGAARSVLGSSPGQAPETQTAIEALLAVEASGRVAMGELRHLLGLLAPAGEAPGLDDAALVPQPDIGQVRALVDRVRAAGLPVELVITGARALPPGVDLAAYRVVQEALTNVIKHANQARTVVSIEYQPRDLLITVTDDGQAAGGPAPSRPPGAGGRGLIGLSERVALYGGELDAGPRPGGGWRVRARIPLEPAGGPGGPLAGAADAGGREAGVPGLPWPEVRARST